MNFNLYAAVFTIIVASLAHAERPFVSTETTVKNTEILFEGTVAAQVAVDSPTKDYTLFDSKKALQIKFKDVVSWKPKPFSKTISVFSRLPQEAPCTSVIVENSKRYVVYGHYDSTKKLILADWCIDIHEASAESGKDIKKTAITLHGEAT